MPAAATSRRSGRYALTHLTTMLARGSARAALLLLLLAAPSADAWPLLGTSRTDTVVLRGHPQTVHVYGERGGYPVLVSSGDGGWIHLGPHVAQLLADQGFFVVGFDVKAYLEGFTSEAAAVRTEDEPADYRVLIDYARRGSSQRPILVGVSEGAGLSVLAATDPTTRLAIAGVIGLGLPDVNELGWRWRDALDLHHARDAERAMLQRRFSRGAHGAGATGRHLFDP